MPERLCAGSGAAAQGRARRGLQAHCPRNLVTAHNDNRLDKPLNEYLTGRSKGTSHSIIRVEPNWY